MFAPVPKDPDQFLASTQFFFSKGTWSWGVRCEAMMWAPEEVEQKVRVEMTSYLIYKYENLKDK